MSKREEIIAKLNEAFKPENAECDGAFCYGCWKDIIHSAISMLQEYHEQESGWNRVSEVLPDNPRDILLRTEMGLYLTGFYSTGDFHAYESDASAYPIQAVTHWKEITPPKI